MIFMIAAIPLVGVISGVKWLCLTAIPWLFAKVAMYWKYLTGKNLFLLGLVIWLAAELTGWGDGFLAFFVGTIGFIGNLLFDFLFDDENGVAWFLFDFGAFMGEWIMYYFPDLAGGMSQYENAFDSSMGWVWMLDKFFPISESVVLFGIYTFFILVFLLFKYLLKLVPGMGG